MASPGVVTISEGVFKFFQGMIQVKSELIVAFDRFPCGQGLKGDAIIVSRLLARMKVDLFELRRTRSIKQKSPFINLSDSEKRFRTGSFLDLVELSSEVSKPVFRGLQQPLQVCFERVGGRGWTSFSNGRRTWRRTWFY